MLNREAEKQEEAEPPLTAEQLAEKEAEFLANNALILELSENTTAYMNNSSTAHYILGRSGSSHTSKKVYPPVNEVFTAFNLTPLDSVRVVILGQDPCE